jgi:hypothetical protein
VLFTAAGVARSAGIPPGQVAQIMTDMISALALWYSVYSIFIVAVEFFINV